MFYLPEDYHDYKYLVELSDNYVVLSKSSHISGSSGDPDSINVIYQYFNPSIYTFETSYRSEDSYYFDNVQSSFSSSIFDRSDFPILFICNFIIIFIFAFILNQLSKLVYKGGIFGNS